MSATTVPDPVRSSRCSRRRAGRVGKVLAVLVVVVLVASCTGRRPTPTGYGDANSSVEKHFITGCMAPQGEGGSVTNTRPVCACAYAAVKKQITFEEFKKINSELSDKPGPLPEKMQKIIADCVAAGG